MTINRKNNFKQLSLTLNYLYNKFKVIQLYTFFIMMRLLTLKKVHVHGKNILNNLKIDDY